jgi:hypothetical protein
MGSHMLIHQVPCVLNWDTSVTCLKAEPSVNGLPRPILAHEIFSNNLHVHELGASRIRNRAPLAQISNVRRTREGRVLVTH